jgi:hypothetical protein
MREARFPKFTPVIPATWEAEIRRIKVGDSLGEIVHKTPSPKNNQNKMNCRCGSSSRAPALQEQSSEFKPFSPLRERKREREDTLYHQQKPLWHQTLPSPKQKKKQRVRISTWTGLSR